MMKNPIFDLKNGGVDLYTSLTYTRVWLIHEFDLYTSKYGIIIIIIIRIIIKVILISFRNWSCRGTS